MKPASRSDGDRHEYLRSLWAKEGGLGRACWVYATTTGDTVFAVQEMVRSQLRRPVPGLWQHLSSELGLHPGVREAVHAALDAQREEVRRAHGRRFTMLALLQQAALRDLTAAHQRGAAGYREVTVAETRCRDLALMARLLIEQEAMREAAHRLGEDHPANLAACRTLYWAAEEALEAFDLKLEAGQPLAEALAIEILLESLAGAPRAADEEPDNSDGWMA
ncbi:MAG TPA: hypothetical protein VNJ71_06910 [Gemmatimonadales bacterium]|jgi:hypothetical protein|nr:hypothetical protein [Gemmatimonadales bacterium]